MRPAGRVNDLSGDLNNRITLSSKEREMTKKLGFIGLGTMGKVVVKRLMDAGYTVTVWNRTPQAGDALVKAGAIWANSPKDVAAQNKVVFTMVSDAPATEAVMFGPDGLLEGAHDGLIIIDSASIAPEFSIAHAERARQKGVAVLDAPVSGGPKVAESGTLGIMVGGSEEAFKVCEPILKSLGSMVLYTGKIGNGTPLKLIAHLVMGVAIEDSAEALVLAAQVGIDRKSVV